MAEMEQEIVVRGTAEVHTLPDRAIVRAEVVGEAADEAAAYKAAARRAKQLDEVIASYEDATDRVVTTALSVRPKTRWHKGETVVTGWRATRSSMVDVEDFTRLGGLIGELAGVGARVQGPEWLVDPTNVAYEDARSRAAEDARRRADAYASALGLRTMRVSWVAEPGLRKGGEATPPLAGAMPGGLMSLDRGGGADEEVIDVSPDEIRIGAQVEVGFRFDVP